VQITGNYNSDEDLINYIDSIIAVNWETEEGRLNLSGKATKEKYQEALRNIKYLNESTDPSEEIRTISITVNDGEENSNTVTREIIIATINNLPELTKNNVVSVDEGGTVIIDGSVLYAEDVDNNLNEVMFVITSLPVNGKLFKKETSVNVNDEISQTEINENEFSYQHDGGESSTDNFGFKLTNSSSADTTEEYKFYINVKAVNDKPVINTIPSITINENESEEIDISGYVEDVDNTDNELTATLTSLTGNLTISKVEGMKYEITPKADWYGTDTIGVVVSDGSLFVEGKITVEVLQVNKNPEIVDLPELVEYSEGGSVEISLVGKLKDDETPENELEVEVTANVDWLNHSYDSKKKVITLSSETGNSGNCELCLRVTDDDGGECCDTIEIKVDPISGITILDGIPTEYSLSQNYPNPFNPTTKIRYAVPEGSQVRVIVYNMLGQEVTELVNKYLGVGTYEVDFDAGKLSSGIYILRFTAGKFIQIKKMILMK
jgi:hypothetical protein